MSSSTSRAAFYKPAGGENINVTTDLNNNWDKLDTNLNWRVVANAAARNAITPYWAGLGVRETDTGRLYVSNGTAPISGSWAEVVQADNTTVGQMLFGNLIRNTRATTGDSAYETRVTGDTFARWYVQAGGSQWWGPGNATFDTNIYRASANLLKTDDSFQAVGNLTVGGSAVTTGNVQVNGDLLLNGGSTIKRNALSSTSTINTSTAEAVLCAFTIPAGDAVAGAVYRITAFGVAGCTATPTLTVRNRLGGLGGTTNATIAITGSSGVTNKVWKIEFYLTCLTTGASGTWGGNLTVEEGLSVVGSNPSTCVTRMDGSGTAVYDTTAAKDMAITVQWSASSASNTITCRGFAAERIA